MVAYYLAISLIIILVLCFFITKQDIIHPTIAFIAPFTLAAIDLLYNINKWNVELKMNTYYVIIGGTLVFILATFIIDIGYKQLRKKCQNIKYKSDTIYKYNISQINKLLFLMLQIFTFLICLIGVIKVARRFGVSGSISELIAGYKNLKTFTTEDVGLGKFVNTLYDFCYASGFVWFYLVAKKYIFKKKWDKLVLINLCLSIAISLEKGSRGGAIALLCSGAVMIIIFWVMHSKKHKISFKQILLIVLAASLVVGMFQTIGELLGRVSAADFGGYLSVYLSAPIRNLDYFLNNSFASADMFGKMTFYHAINYLGGKLEISSWIYELVLPPLRANGFVTGNVYTTFYAYIYDFGYVGVPIFMFLMGVISQLFYIKTKNNTKYLQRDRINIWIIIYSYIFYMLAFSFFSNKFYEGIFSIQFFKYLIYWSLIKLFLENVKIKNF